MCEVLIVDGEMMMVRANGHATGSSACCNGISTLLYSLAGFLQNDARACIDELTLEEADARIVFTGAKWAKGAMQLVKIGFLQLERAFPEYMRVEVLEKN